MAGRLPISWSITVGTKYRAGRFIHADKGIVMFRRMLKEQIEIVQKGGDPFGVIRDPTNNTILHIDLYNETIGLLKGAFRNQEIKAKAS